MRYRVILDYEGSFQDDELALNIGDIVNVIQEAHDGRLFCELNGNQGFVISFFLDMEKDQSVLEDCMICNEKKILFRTAYACEDTCCQDCISNHVKAQLERNNLRIQCLACKELMKIEDLQRVLPRDVFSLYEETSTIRSLSDDPKYVSCLNPKCGVGQYHEGGEDQPIVTCPKCYCKSCFVHKMPWHYDQTCQEYDDSKKNQIQQNEDYILNHTKPCPKCKKMIEKSDEKDCDKMVCACGYRFCWECLNDYDTILKEGNHEHKKSCRHYREIEPPTEGNYFAKLAQKKKVGLA